MVSICECVKNELLYCKKDIELWKNVFFGHFFNIHVLIMFTIHMQV